MIATVSVLVVLLSQASAVVPAGSDTKAQAQALLNQGTALYGRGDFAGALGKFQAAYGIYPSPKLQFNIAQADRELGRPVEAIEAFEQFLAEAPKSPPELLSEAYQSVADLQSKLAQISVKCERASVAVTLDGKVIGRTPLVRPFWATPGQHQIAISSEEYKPLYLVLTAGESRAVVFEAKVAPRTLVKNMSAAGASVNAGRKEPPRVSAPPEEPVVAAIAPGQAGGSTSTPVLSATPRSQPQSASHPDDEVSQTGPETQWYGGPAVAIDAVNLGLLFASAAEKSQVVALSLIVYPFGVSIVHGAHHQGRRAGESILLRFGGILAGLGAAVGIVGLTPCGNSEAPGYCLPLVASTFAAFPVAAMVIDDVFLAREPARSSAQQEGLAPLLFIDRQLALIGVARTF